MSVAIVVLALAAPIAHAAPARRCGTPDATVAERDQVRAALARWQDEHHLLAGGGTIRVAVHVITSGSEGDVSDGHVAAQMSALDRAYARLGYHFELASVDRTDQPAWYHLQPGGTTERAAKHALAVDPAHTLNLYVCAPAAPLLGWSSTPFATAEDSPAQGVVVSGQTLDDGPEAAGLGGRTAVHEVGHYLGLLQTCASDAELPAVEAEQSAALVALYRPSLLGEDVEIASPESIVTDDEPTRVLAFRGGIPNPFRTDTAIRFTMPVSGHVTLRVYDVAGKLVRTLVDAQLPPGDHNALLRGEGLASGTYFTVLRVGQVHTSRSLTLIR
jgi:hypothetical protein